MSLLEFETFVHDGVIQLPDEMASQIPTGTAVRISIMPVDATTQELSADEAWDSFLEFVEERKGKGTQSAPYQWRREDAYEHLE